MPDKGSINLATSIQTLSNYKLNNPPMKIVLFSTTIILALFTGCSNKGSISIDNAPTSVSLYSPAFIEISVKDTFANPFDQEQVKINLEVTDPQGKTLIIPCFFKNNGKEESAWEARFTPRAKGSFSYFASIETNGKKEISQDKKLEVNESTLQGLLSLDSTNRYFLNFDNGQLFRGLGLNVGWEFEPKWGNAPKCTFEMYFDTMAMHKANFARIWICPWNSPIEWTSVPTYKTSLDEFTDFSKANEYSKDLKIHNGLTAYSQTAVNQLLPSGSADGYIVYKLDSVRKTKIMVFYRDKFNKDDIEISYSLDNTNYTPIETILSESWDVTNNWKRVFVFSKNEIPQPAAYLKYVFKKSLNKENTKIGGIHISYGNPLWTLDCNGLGQYSAKNSERLDEIVEYATKKGIYIMLALGYHGQFNPIMDSWGANDEWQRNPYNVKNGGPCKEPADFFINPEAKKHYKNYLRYFVARWGYSPAIAVWEFWNEIDIAMNSQHIPVENLVSWHDEMATYLKSVDPYKHIVSTSTSGSEIKGLWNAKDIDLSQVHRYEPCDGIIEKTFAYIEKYKKPHVVGEYAIGWKGPGNDFSADEYEGDFHDGMWRGLFTPVTILPMSWWWDYYMDMKQYYHFDALADIIKVMSQKDPYTCDSIASPAGFELRKMSNTSLAIVWLKKKKNNKNPMVNLELPMKGEGEYSVKILNTWANKVLDSTIVKTNQKILGLTKLDMSKNHDVAIIISKK